MGDESISLERNKFDLSDLGLLDGESAREFEIITRNACIILQGCAAVFCLPDYTRSSVFLRASYVPRGKGRLPEIIESSQSLFSGVSQAQRSIRIADLSTHPEFENSDGLSELPVKSLLSVPVYGPARELIGALIVLSNVPREWAELERMELKDQAHLLSKQVLLRASLETLKRMSRERTAFSSIAGYRN